MAELKRTFRPEFLNRLDEIIVFKSLTATEISQIVSLMIDDLRQRLIALNMTINLSQAALEYVAKEGTDVTFGARPLRRAIQRLLEDPLSEQILEGKWTSGSVIQVGFKNDKLTFTQGKGSIPAPRKRDNIARETELLLTQYNLGAAGTGVPSGVTGDGAAD